MNLIIITNNGNGLGNIYRFNKDFDTWKPLPKKVTITNNGNDHYQKRKKSLPIIGHTKEKKETITKETYQLVDIDLSKKLLKLIKENTPTFKQPNIESWANHIRLMREKDERTRKQIEFVIEWSQKDTFWQSNILSTKKLREKFDTLVAQIKRKTNKKQWTII